MVAAMKDNPLLILANVAGVLVSAGLGLSNIMGWTDLSAQQLTAIAVFNQGFWNALGVTARQMVVPIAKHEAAVQRALAIPPTGYVPATLQIGTAATPVMTTGAAGLFPQVQTLPTIPEGAQVDKEALAAIVADHAAGTAPGYTADPGFAIADSTFLPPPRADV